MSQEGEGLRCRSQDSGGTSPDSDGHMEFRSYSNSEERFGDILSIEKIESGIAFVQEKESLPILVKKELQLLAKVSWSSFSTVQTIYCGQSKWTIQGLIESYLLLLKVENLSATAFTVDHKNRLLETSSSLGVFEINVQPFSIKPWNRNRSHPNKECTYLRPICKFIFSIHVYYWF